VLGGDEVLPCAGIHGTLVRVPATQVSVARIFSAWAVSIFTVRYLGDVILCERHLAIALVMGFHSAERWSLVGSCARR